MSSFIESNSFTKQINTLRCSDKTLGKLINVIGPLTIPVPTKHHEYENLIKSIIGQQLSPKPAKTIYEKVKKLCIEVKPETILSIPDIDLRNLGVSSKKVTYLKDLSTKVLLGDLDLLQLHMDSNAEVIQKLSRVKGIGNWTAEMFLIFTLGRTDVLSLSDVGLQRSCKWLYNLESNTEGKKLLELKLNQWKPHLTLASLYLWESVNKGFVVNFSSIDEIA
ncbi:DNA-3-methyladenine glycosylase 2 family protein [Bacillus sp. 1P10SD]|uniref:DNA-3-methyladenine glycosylase family protein n=1 Tax=Bacillus sp. 1P10SD TaxID=3132265 RepID=UPI0039A5C7BC